MKGRTAAVQNRQPCLQTRQTAGVRDMCRRSVGLRVVACNGARRSESDTFLFININQLDALNF